MTSVSNNTIKIKSTARNRKILIVIAAAILFCVIAGIGVYKVLTPKRTTVYIFKSDYSAGTLVTAEMLSSVEVDSNIVVSGHARSTGDFYVTQSNYRDVLSSAGVLRADVYAGNPFMSSMLTTTGGNSIEMTMKTNAVAVTVGVDNITGITPELSTGSRVNVYASYNDSTTLILENIRVLYVGGDGSSISSVSLEVDIRQSLQLVHAYTYGKVQLGLVDATGYKYSSDSMPTYSIGGGFMSYEDSYGQYTEPPQQGQFYPEGQTVPETTGELQSQTAEQNSD